MLARLCPKFLSKFSRVRARTILYGVASGGLLCALALSVSCVSDQMELVLPSMIPGATFVGNDQCEACHDKQVKNFARSVHARIHVPGAKLAGRSGCESCHGPASKHVEAGGGKGVFIVNPGKSPDTCFACHAEKKAQFRLPNHHPLFEGRINCIDCHDAHGTDAKKPTGLAMARTNDTCAKCHKEQTQRFAYEHRALREGCTVCHQVHGSINKKMLKYSDAHICLQCHASPPVAGSRADAFNNQGGGMPVTRIVGGVPVPNRGHAGDLARGGVCWSCHDSIHGSNTNSTFRY